MKTIVSLLLISLLIVGCTPTASKEDPSQATPPPLTQPSDDIPVQENQPSTADTQDTTEIVNDEPSKPEETAATTPPSTSGSEHVVEITSNGFSPQSLAISEGDTVTFVNKDSRQHWPASNVHPTHTLYPGSGITKCGTSEEENIFDACHALAPGESYSFTFREIGTWAYHDHLRASMGGQIVVG